MVALPYEQVRLQIRTSDLLLFRGRGIMATLIGRAGRSPYTHAAKAIWWPDAGSERANLMCVEMREFRGGRAVTLDSQVQRHPGRIDVFTLSAAVEALYNREEAAATMVAMCGHDYGYGSLWRAAWCHLVGVRLFARPNIDDAYLSGEPLFCSAACAVADRVGGGLDPVPTLADQWVEPADLARSAVWSYRFTLEA